MWQVTENIDWWVSAHAGTYGEKHADDNISRHRVLETSVAKRLILSTEAGNSLFDFDLATAERHQIEDFADMQASNATHGTTLTASAQGATGKPANYDNNMATLNGYLVSNVGAYPKITLQRLDLDAKFGTPPSTAETTSAFYQSDNQHYSENPGESRSGQLYMLPYLVITFGLTQWTPLALTPKIWLDATNPGSSFNTGDLVSMWSDLSGNANHATSSGGLRPTYTTNVAGYPSPNQHLPAMVFAAAQGMAIPAIDFTGTQAISIFWVGYAPAVATLATLWDLGSAPSSITTGLSFQYTTVGRAQTVLKGDVGTNTTANASQAIGTNNVVVGIVLDKSITVAARESRIRVNATAEATGGAVNNTNAFGNLASYLGSLAGAGASQQWTGGMCELIVVPRAVTLTEFNRAINALASKWSAY